MNIFIVIICQCYLPNKNDCQSEEINVTDEPQAENRPVPVHEAEIRWTKSFLGRPLCLFCLAATQKITHAAHSLSLLGELYVDTAVFWQNVVNLINTPIRAFQYLFTIIQRPVSKSYIYNLKITNYNCKDGLYMFQPF